MGTRMVSLTVLSAAVVLGGACQGVAGSQRASASQPVQAAKPKVDACSLLTTEEIAAVTGDVVARIEPAMYAATATCNYSVQAQLLPVVSVLLAPSGPKVASSAEMATWRSKQAKGMSTSDIKFIIEPVEGLGVPAIRNEIVGAGMVTIEAAVKGRMLDVTTSSLEHSKALLAKAMVRLP